MVGDTKFSQKFLPKSSFDNIDSFVWTPALSSCCSHSNSLDCYHIGISTVEMFTMGVNKNPHPWARTRSFVLSLTSFIKIHLHSWIPTLSVVGIERVGTCHILSRSDAAFITSGDRQNARLSHNSTTWSDRISVIPFGSFRYKLAPTSPVPTNRTRILISVFLGIGMSVTATIVFYPQRGVKVELDNSDTKSFVETKLIPVGHIVRIIWWTEQCPTELWSHDKFLIKHRIPNWTRNRKRIFLSRASVQWRMSKR